MEKEENKIWKFFWQIIKPYKWWFLLMIPAPIFGGFWSIIQNLVFKEFVDVFSQNKVLDYTTLFTPIAIFIFLIVFNQICWKIRDFAYTKSQPAIRGEIVTQSYNKITNYSYTYFQNVQSGSIVSKIKSIVGGYDDFFNSVFDNIPIYAITATLSVLSCVFVHFKVFLILLVWLIIYSIIALKLSLKLNKIGYKESQAKHQAIALIADNITNIFTLFSFAKKNKESKRIATFIKNNATKKDYDGNMMYTINNLIMAILYIAMMIFIIFYIVDLRMKDSITNGEFIFILISIFRVADTIHKLILEIVTFIRKLGDFKASCQILKINPEILDKKDARVLDI